MLFQQSPSCTKLHIIYQHTEQNCLKSILYPYRASESILQLIIEIHMEFEIEVPLYLYKVSVNPIPGEDEAVNVEAAKAIREETKAPLEKITYKKCKPELKY